ncbi:MAG: HepT-like ribonuclease domain-containing protein [Bacteroidota bacterium]
MKRGDAAYIKDMISAMEKVLKYLDQAGGLSDFLKNEMAIDAITRNYEIVGEAANKVSQSLKEKNPELSWKQMYGL